MVGYVNNYELIRTQKALEDETKANVEESAQMDELICNLEKQIEEYKRDYAELIRQEL